MMYPFMTLNDDTEITHSEMRSDGTVEVYIETPDAKDGFHHATCILPNYKWENHDYTEAEMHYYKDLVERAAHLFIKFAKGGGFEHASNF